MELFLLSALTFVASFVGTLTGFGSSTLMVPILSLFYPFPITLLFVGIIHAFNDFWKIILFKHALNWKVLLVFGIPGLIFSIIGGGVVFALPQQNLLRILGLVLLGYTIYLFFKPKFELPKNNALLITGGILSGFLAGVFGVGGAVRSMFLSAFNFEKDVFLFTSGATALFIDLPRLGVYSLGGTRIGVDLATSFLILIPISFVSAEFAKKAVDKIPQNKFRLVVSGFLFLIGLRLLLF